MDLQALQVTITALQHEVTHLRQQSSTRGTSRPKPVLPDPEKFSNAFQYYIWLSLIKIKLRIDAEAIGNDETQFFYLYGNLNSKIQSIVLPHLTTAENNDVWDYNTILDQLDRVYKLDVQLKFPETYDKFVKTLYKFGSSDGGSNFSAAFGGSSNNPVSRPHSRSQFAVSESMDTSANMQFRVFSFGTAPAPTPRRA